MFSVDVYSGGLLGWVGEICRIVMDWWGYEFFGAIA